MVVAKSKHSNSMELVKQDGNDSLDMLIRGAVGKEPFLSFPRPDNNPAQLFQLLHAFDQPELPGWPLLTPLKVQMQKCEKCSREFCSPVNYRRHHRFHRRSRKPDKDIGKDRNMLGAFWDKLSADEAKKIVSLKGMMLKEVSGSSVEAALAALIQRPGFTALPQYYVRAGSHLLDIIQASPLRFPISSQELFSIIDDASEKTFLCGAASSMQTYIFDGETGKNALDAKNVVASTSFLLELKLIEAWLSDMDAEALRCQKLLVEEEEAAQRRQAELLERKRKKKLRQKEQRMKEQRIEEKEEAKGSESTTTSLEDEGESTTSVPMKDSSSLKDPEPLEPQAVLGSSDDVYGCNNVERRMGPSRRLVPEKPQREMPNGAHSNLGGLQKQSSGIANATKVWSRKGDKTQDGGVVTQVEQTKKSQVLIGSICVTLGNDDHRGEEDGRRKKVGPSTVKVWRPVSRAVENGEKEVERNGDEDKNGSFKFNSREAKAFLAQRWNEAISEEHVTLVLSGEDDGLSNHMTMGTERSLEASKGRAKFRMKRDKASKVKYVPRQRTST